MCQFSVQKVRVRIRVTQVHAGRQIQRRSQEFDLGGYKWVKETKQPHKKLRLTDFGGIYTNIPPVTTPLDTFSSYFDYCYQTVVQSEVYRLPAT